MNKNNNDEIIKFISEEISAEKSGLRKKMKTWKLIVADDDEEVHAVTNLALSSFRFKERPLTILSAYSSDETKKLIMENPDTAVILLDVVMENHDSGLQLVKFIRETANNALVRIILRTGQPGFAPELKVITNFDINDYKEKTELTSSKLITALISSLRNHDDLKRIEGHKKNLELVASSAAIIHGLESTVPFNTTIYKTLKKLFNRFSEEIDTGLSIYNGFITGKTLFLEEGSGEFESAKGEMDLKEMIPPLIYEKIENTKSHNNIFFMDHTCTILIKTRRGSNRIIHLKNTPNLTDMEKSIIKTFSLNLTTVYNNIELIDEQKKIEEQIRNSLKEKQILVKEIHHRVKNNLQIISSLLHMQSNGIKDKKLLSIIQESENRVQSMSLVHEKLYQSDMMATIEFSEYIRSLSERLISTYSVYNEIELNFETEQVMLSINTAIPCGLIVNEILTNSMKYAFPGNKKGEISIQLKIKKNDVYLKISDNGIGLPQQLDTAKIKSLGLKLIQILAVQIDGKLEIKSEKGVSFNLTFPNSEEREQ